MSTMSGFRLAVKFISAALCVAILAVSSSSLPAQDAGMLPNITEPMTRQKYVAFWQKELAKELELRAKRFNPETDVENARISLAWARYFLNVEEGHFAIASEQLHIIAAIFAQQRDRLLRLERKGAVSEGQLDAAEGRVALIRFCVALVEGRPTAASRQLTAYATVCEKLLNRDERLHSRGFVADRELDSARCSLALARYLLTLVHGDREAADEQLRANIALHEKDLKRLYRLQDSGSVLDVQLLIAQDSLALWRLWLAEHREDREAIARELETLVAVGQETADLIRSTPGPTVSNRSRFLAHRLRMLNQDSERLKATEQEREGAYWLVYRLTR